MKADTPVRQDVLAEPKRGAERPARRVSGVKASAIGIDVRPPGSGKRNDADIARKAENALQWMTYLPKDSVKVMVESGWITLSGEVDWPYQKQAAAGVVRCLRGVRGVSDHIAIGPKVSLSALKSDIEAELKCRARAATQKISVAVQGASVTLTGVVDSWSERELAWQCARATPGVRNVVDHITVSKQMAKDPA